MNLPSVRTDRATARRRSRGQVVVIFAGAMLAFVGLMAIVIDISWYWASSLRVQRAADAAALAGVVWLPGNYGSADTVARNEATKNGYTAGVNGVAITTQQDPTNDRRLIVTIAAPVPTFFARVLGLNSIMSKRTSFAEFVLPVPMGSPENYYGTFGIIRNQTITSTVPVTAQTETDWQHASAWPAGGTWTTPKKADQNDDNVYGASTTTTGSAQEWSNFGFAFVGTVNSIDGIQVQMREDLTGNGNNADCRILAAVSWNNGVTYTADKSITPPNITENLLTIPAAANDLWGHAGWTATDFSNAEFRLRLTWSKIGVPDCPATRNISIDTLEVDVTYTNTTTGTSTATLNNNIGAPSGACDNGAANCFQPDGTPLNARGFWATMNTEGASNINGDAHQPYYDNATSNVADTCPSSLQACYDPPKTGTSGQNVGSNYYNYAIEMPPGSTQGKVYVFDPSFCATDHASGTGDRWFSGNNSVNSYYDLYNTNGTLYTLLDDTLVKGTGSTFTGMDGWDTTMRGGGSTTLPSGDHECKQTGTGVAAYGDYRDYHDSWYLLNPINPLSGSGPTGTIYRLHTTGTDAANLAGQRNTNGEQSFAIYASATGGTPKIYGLGAMQMYTPLSSSGGTTSSEFYLAQVPAVHAGKTIEIGLWDPGDTSPLSASLAIEIPSSTIGVWTATNFTWTATKGTTSGLSGCNGTVHANVSSVTTATPTSKFNGCWLTIDVPIPSGYAGYQQGWWKIKYTMTGTGTSDDVTTWTAIILGNPVHLVLP